MSPEPIIHMGADDFLMEAGHEVAHAEHGLEAHRCFEDHPDRFTAMLTEFELPYGMSGAMLIEHARKPYPGIPMLLTSAYGNPVTADWVAHHRVHLVLMPFSFSDVVDLLGQLLRPDRSDALH